MTTSHSERRIVSAIIREAAEVLRKKYGTPIRLKPLRTFKASPNKRASTVVRCRVLTGADQLPSTLIVKKVRFDGGAKASPYQPDSPNPDNIAIGFFNEWAALKLLRLVANGVPLGPALYAADRSFGLLVMEDLGDGNGRNVDDAVYSRDTEAATQALLDLARTTGQLHAQTAGRAEEFYDFRHHLGPAPRQRALFSDPWSDARRARIPKAEIEAAIEMYRTQCANINVQPHRGFDAEIEHVAQQIENPHPSLLVLSQRDQNWVGGCVRWGSRLRMYDFDTAGYRHALREGVPARITWGGMLRVPQDLTQQMDRAYQAELARGCPMVADDNEFHRAMVEAGGHWHVFHVAKRLPDGLQGDRPRGDSSLRTQVVGWISGFAQMPEEFGHLPALGQTARSIVERLRGAWPSDVHTPPLWPAFRQ